MSIRKLFTSAAAASSPSFASTSIPRPFAFCLSSRASSSSSSSQPPSSSSSSPPPTSNFRPPAQAPHLSPSPYEREPKSARSISRRKLKPVEQLTKHRVFVTNLPYNLPDETLGELFYKLTSVSPVSVNQPRRKRTKKASKVRNAGFGFVEWVDEREGWDAVWKAVEMSGKIEVEGRTLTIVRGTPVPPKSSPPRAKDEEEEEDDEDGDEDEAEWEAALEKISKDRGSKK